jgi:DNA anti-recombination protein RmuC
MKPINVEIKKVVNRVKEAQVQLQKMVKSHDWIDDARHYAERQGKEVKKLFTSDVEKLKAFLERERKELESFQKHLPSEMKKIRKFVNVQKKEFGKLLLSIRKITAESVGTAAKARKLKKSTKPKKSSSTTGSRKKSSTTSHEASTHA